MTADQLGTVALLTKAADLADKAAELLQRLDVMNGIRDGRWDWDVVVVLLGSGPDHWRAVAAMLRAMLEIHAPLPNPTVTCQHDGKLWDLWGKDSGCATLAVLRPLAELVVQQLGDTE